MKMEVFNSYIVDCKGPDQKIYRWNLEVQPWKNAWKIVGQDIKVGQFFKGYLILAVKEIEQKPAYDYGISKNDFHNAVIESNIDFAVTPVYNSLTYRCDFCDGVVANDICTTCMFDWDS